MGTFTLVCSACGVVQTQPYSPFCERCGKMTEALYDLDNVQLYQSDNPFERFFDLIPVKNRLLLPQNASFSPLVHSKGLGSLLCMENLYLKNETTLPAGTTKYRMAAVSLPFLFESGVRHFCTSSTGNSSTAYAQAINNIPDMQMSLFTGSEFRERVNYESSPQINHYILLGGSFVEAFDYAAEFAKEHGYVSERGFFNAGRREGLKLAFFEAADQIHETIDWYVQAVSSAMGVYGTYKGAKDLLKIGQVKKLPHLLCAQQETCSPLVNAWRDDADSIEEKHIVRNPTGIAMAILRGDPSRVYPYVRAIVKESQGEMLSVSEFEIRNARALIMDLEGIEICFSSATAVAGLIKAVNRGIVSKTARVLINLTGRERESTQIPEDVIKLEKIDGKWIISTDRM